MLSWRFSEDALDTRLDLMDCLVRILWLSLLRDLFWIPLVSSGKISKDSPPILWNVVVLLDSLWRFVGISAVGFLWDSSDSMVSLFKEIFTMFPDRVGFSLSIFRSVLAFQRLLRIFTSSFS